MRQTNLEEITEVSVDLDENGGSGELLHRIE